MTWVWSSSKQRVMRVWCIQPILLIAQYSILWSIVCLFNLLFFLLLALPREKSFFKCKENIVFLLETIAEIKEKRKIVTFLLFFPFKIKIDWSLKRKFKAFSMFFIHSVVAVKFFGNVMCSHWISNPVLTETYIQIVFFHFIFKIFQKTFTFGIFFQFLFFLYLHYKYFV